MANTYTSNVSLPRPINTSQIFEDFTNLSGEFNAAMDILESALTGIQPAATVGVNASIINTGGKRLVKLQLLSAGCISSITGMIQGSPFTLLFMSTGSMGMADTGAFKLSAALTPSVDDALTLVWGGTNYYELSRSSN